MDLQGERLIPATPETTWAALNDPETLKACIAGCESLERLGDDEYLAAVALRIGPVNARFKGRLRLQNVVPPTSYTIAFEGQGGAAGFGKGSADVRLSPDPAGTRLDYSARAQVGGRLAQVGSRLIDGAAAKIAEDFFKAFESRLGAEARTGEGAAAGEAAAGTAPPGAAGADDARAAAAGTAAHAREDADRTQPGGTASRWLPWIVAIVVIAALIAYWGGLNEDARVAGGIRWTASIVKCSSTRATGSWKAATSG